MSKAIEKASLDQIVANVETAAEQYGLSTIRAEKGLVQAIKMSQGLQLLRETLTNDFMEQYIMPLQSTPLGFKTDKDNPPENAGPHWKPGYELEVVRECLVEATIRGLRPVGNEFNIIAKSCYAAKNGLERLVREFPGISDLQYEAGVPVINLEKQGAVVPFYAAWKLNGTLDAIRCEYTQDKDTGNTVDTRIAVKVNRGMGPDAVIGKATRKMFARILTKLTGTTIPEGDVGDDIPTTGEDITDKPSGAAKATEDLIEKHRQQAKERKNGGAAAQGATAPAEQAAEQKTEPKPPEKPATREPGED